MTGTPDSQLRERAVESLVRQRRSGALFGAWVIGSIVLVTIWGLTGFGYFWPGWAIVVGLLAAGAVSLARTWSDRSFSEPDVRTRMAHLSGTAPPGIQR
jgi:protein-S-isoprenylcysteine O-methyltransferase Ste14